MQERNRDFQKVYKGEHMKKTPLFEGLCTALATPMKDGEVDYLALRRLIAYQLEQKVDALLLLGTTGEAATLTREERRKIAEIGGEMTNGKAKYILGCGSNSTALTLDYAKDALDCGADGILLVTPYYNKGTEKGIVAHFETVADQIPLPQILYHVPSRTGVHFTLAQIRRLSAHPRIVGVKEACPDLDFLQDEMAASGDALDYYAGNDSLAIPTLSLGGIGLISVISNLFPQKTGEMIRHFRAGKTAEALTVHRQLLPMMRLLFRETNPAPLKYALSLLGYGTGEVRLPLAEIDTPLKEDIKKEMEFLEEQKIL